jgi:hypothetical protein
MGSTRKKYYPTRRDEVAVNPDAPDFDSMRSSYLFSAIVVIHLDNRSARRSP